MKKMKKLLLVLIMFTLCYQITDAQMCEDYPQNNWGMQYPELNQWGVNISDSVNNKLHDLTGVSSTIVGFQKEEAELPSLTVIIPHWGNNTYNFLEWFDIAHNQTVKVQNLWNDQIWGFNKHPNSNGYIATEGNSQQMRHYTQDVSSFNYVVSTMDPHVGRPKPEGILVNTNWSIAYDQSSSTMYNKFSYSLKDYQNIGQIELFNSEVFGLKPMMTDFCDSISPWLRYPNSYRYYPGGSVLDWAHSNGIDYQDHMVIGGETIRDVIVGIRHGGFVFQRVNLTTGDTLRKMLVFGNSSIHSDVTWYPIDPRMQWIAEHDVRLMYVDSVNVLFSFFRNGFDVTMPAEAIVANLSLVDSTVVIEKRHTFLGAWGTGLGSVQVLDWQDDITSIDNLSEALLMLQDSWLLVNTGTVEPDYGSGLWECETGGALRPQYALINPYDEVAWAGTSIDVSYQVLGIDSEPFSESRCFLDGNNIRIEFDVPTGTDNFYVNGDPVDIVNGKANVFGVTDLTYVGIAEPGNRVSEYIRIDDPSVDCSVTVNSSESINNSQFTIYPNPAFDIVYVVGLTPGTHYEVTDMLGRKVLEGDLTEDFKIDLSGQRPGILFLRINNTVRSVMKH